MLNPLTSVVVYLTEMLISYIFFSNVLEKRFSSGRCLVIGATVFGAACAGNLFLDNNIVVNTVTTILANSSFAILCFEIRWIIAVFYSLILCAVNAVWEFAAISLVSAMTKSHFFDYNSDFALFILECPLSKTLYFFTVLIFSRLVKSTVQRKRLPLALFLYPAAVTVCLVLFWIVCAHAGITADGQKYLAAASMILLCSTVLLFVTYQHQMEQENEAMQMRSEFTRLQTEKAYYDILEQQNQQLMLYAHDAKNHLAAIGSLSDDPRIGGYLSKLSVQLSDYTRNCHSGNKMLDVMIHKFAVDCSMRNIHFEYDVKLCNLNEVEDIDLVAILGNLIDNAVSAAEKTREKRVSLATARRNAYSVIVISNSCDTQPKTSGTHLVTSKENKSAHGFGLKSVRKTLRKYNGDYEWMYDADRCMFVVTAMIGSHSLK